MTKRKPHRQARLAEVKPQERPRCGLCGKTITLTKTDCCGQWICDDEDQYVLFSFARNSCSRNHRRYTLCGYHYNEGHPGKWQECSQCRESFETEMYVYYGTNEYNFEKLVNPPSYEPTRCTGTLPASLGDEETGRHKGMNTEARQEGKQSSVSLFVRWRSRR